MTTSSIATTTRSPIATRPAPPRTGDRFADAKWNIYPPVESIILFDGGQDSGAQYYVTARPLGERTGYASGEQAIAALQQLTRGKEAPGAFVLRYRNRFYGREGAEGVNGNRAQLWPMNVENSFLGDVTDPASSDIIYQRNTGPQTRWVKGKPVQVGGPGPVAALVDGAVVANWDHFTLPKGSQELPAVD